MTQEAADYIKALTEWYANEVKRVLGGGYQTQGDPGSSGPPKPPV